MAHKVTAFMLALLIGSPMCWCGWMHQQAQVAESSCCHQKAGKTEEGHQTPASAPGSQDCPCSKAPKAREATVTKIAVPALQPSDYTPPPWLGANVFARIEFWQPMAVQTTEHGPPSRAVPLYVRDCSLLI